MAFNVTQGQQNYHYLIGHTTLPIRDL